MELEKTQNLEKHIERRSGKVIHKISKTMF